MTMMSKLKNHSAHEKMQHAPMPLGCKADPEHVKDLCTTPRGTALSARGHRHDVVMQHGDSRGLMPDNRFVLSLFRISALLLLLLYKEACSSNLTLYASMTFSAQES